MKSRRKWRIEWSWLIAVALVIVLGLYWIPGRARDKQDSYSPTPRGKSAFYTLVAGYVKDTSRHERGLIPPGDAPRTLVILGPARYPRDGEWRRLAAWVKRGNALVFAARLQDPLVDLPGFGLRIVPAQTTGRSFAEKLLGVLPPKPDDDADDSFGGGADDKSSGAGAAYEPKLGAGSPEMKIKTSLVPGKIRWFARGRLKVTAGSPLRPQVLVTGKGGDQALVARLGQGRVVVVASDEIFTNQSHLLGKDHPVLAHRLLEQRGVSGPVVFDEHLNVTGTPKVLGLLFESTLRPITLQLLLVAALFGWWGSRRFGPARPPINPPRRSIVEHAEALGNLHFRAGTGARSVATYLEYWRAEMRLGGAPTSQRQQIAVLARRTGRDPEEVAQLLRAAANAAQQLGVSAAQATHIIRELSRLKQQIQRTARGTHANR